MHRRQIQLFPPQIVVSPFPLVSTPTEADADADAQIQYTLYVLAVSCRSAVARRW